MKLTIEGLNNTIDIERLFNAFFSFENEETNIEANIIIRDETVSIAIYKDNEKVYYVNKTVIDDKKENKRMIKRSLFKGLVCSTQKVLPWGIITGIRPIKIPIGLLKKGYTEEAVRKELKEQYLITDDKINMMLNIAKEELKVLSRYHERDYSIYIGIPFCPTRCLYCSFPSYPIDQSLDISDLYLEALEKEITFVANRYKKKQLKTLYIGGGTPTTLTEKQLEKLINIIKAKLDLSQLDEWTVEAGRPDSINFNKLRTLKEAGVTRISINPQSMNQETLNRIGRKHTTLDIEKAFKDARTLGFDNINMDLIIGLPQETSNEVENTLKQVKRLDPDSITIHSLAIKKGSQLKEELDDYNQISNKEIIKIQSLIQDYVKEKDLIPYYLYRQKKIVGNLENVGYAKKDKISRYNILIMEEQQTIIGMGAGAITKMVDSKNNKINRIENVKNVNDYINRIDEMINRKQAL
ncbi:oxygen-independent coproporphyrinogen-3 oxidase [Natranaerovirga hydrolytica]|uniref:Oxygen-independent coproporphyrinogen-3 oxidase n=1 Tax=Natranaerovirga hydrolytica TaxID=680378 RepID=A0A4R1MZ29_9FIRM|nr:coproporphyrinogen dehydrogenase HemZ [Natranaerovirga hydrolytica]TCK97802.1 oxygen-independent coproporphyrinogen-3 oxidase [Natranaerovirga hydrolytica]